MIVQMAVLGGAHKLVVEAATLEQSEAAAQGGSGAEMAAGAAERAR